MNSRQHVWEIQQFRAADLERIFALAQAMSETPERYATALAGKIVATLFYEPSTRTRLSFESAVLRLGGACLGTESARLFSSAAKGETLRDTIRVVSGYADAIVLRYDQAGGAEEAAEYSSVPVINAGDGTGQHPTQALTDMYTIIKHFGVPHNLTFALVGDLANGRTVHSLAYLLAKHYPDNRLVFISPGAVKLPQDIRDYLNRKEISWRETDEWDSALEKADVVYMTRVQQERFELIPELYEEVNRETMRLSLSEALLRRMKATAIILHPLPRLGEIAPEVDHDPRAAYFEQTRNGLVVRMALLTLLLGPN